jgi:hypothetical protein
MNPAYSVSPAASRASAGLVVPRSNRAAIFQLPDLTLVTFDLRTAPVSGCDLVQEGHNSVIASLDQSLEMPSRMDTG